jgi:hypothetical protein
MQNGQSTEIGTATNCTSDHVNGSKTDGLGGDLVQFKYDASQDVFYLNRRTSTTDNQLSEVLRISKIGIPTFNQQTIFNSSSNVLMQGTLSVTIYIIN